MTPEQVELIVVSYVAYVWALIVLSGVLVVALIAILGIITTMVPRRSRHRARRPRNRPWNTTP